MLDEPYRWIEAVENRREYIEERLQSGSPVVALAYDRGLLLLSVSRGEPKVFEVYDRMAVSAVGHPADIEKLRMQMIDMAHVEGFSKSQSDVTLHRLVNFGLAPTVKQAFDTVFGSPFIVKVIAAELGQGRRPNQFYAISYDGEVQTHQLYSVITGREETDARLLEYLAEQAGDTQCSLRESLQLALRTWAFGKHLIEDEDETDPSDEAIQATVDEQLGHGRVDAAVLDVDCPGSSKFRKLTDHDIKSYFE